MGSDLCMGDFSGFDWEHSTLVFTFERQNVQNISAIRGGKDGNKVKVESLQLENRKHMYWRKVANML